MLFNLEVYWKRTWLLTVVRIDVGWAWVVEIKQHVIYNLILNPVSTKLALSPDDAVLVFQTACRAYDVILELMNHVLTLQLCNGFSFCKTLIWLSLGINYIYVIFMKKISHSQIVQLIWRGGASMAFAIIAIRYIQFRDYLQLAT